MAAEKLLFLHCKKGNLDEVKRVVELRDVDLNIRDRWDSTPLYYACLCGHLDVVEYLLSNGSKCEASTFDGERCLYGALTNEIRNVLRSWKQIHSTVKQRDNHYELLRRMFEEDKTYKDIYFNVQDEEIGAHRCLLAARSPFFIESLATRWLDKRTVTVKHDRVDPDAFKSMLQFLYLGRVDVPYALVCGFKKLANHCKLSHLLQEISSAEQKVAKLVDLKPGMRQKVKILTIESENSFKSLKDDLRELAESTFPVELRTWIDEGVLPFYEINNNSQLSMYPDICVEVENFQFFCHRVFLCGHSDYFTALIVDHFNESDQSSSDVLTIHLRKLSAEIFRHVIIYIYSGRTEFFDINIAFDVLTTADLLLLPGLKRLCGNILSEFLEEDNVVELYQCSQMYNLPNLEDRCAEFMAFEIENLVESEEFMSLVLDEALQVKEREETDSIPLVDDIRHCITGAAETVGEMEEANGKLAKLDAMLSRLGIEC